MTTHPGIIESQEVVMPAMANHHGTLFAGHGLQLLAKIAFIAARSLSGRDVVMASATRVDFLAPVPIGYVLTVRAFVSRIGRSSMTVCVSGLAETPNLPQEEVLKAVFEMVAVDAQGCPVAIDATHLKKETA
jgi:acyl-CoA thioesterase YciA